jgi:tripartite-type tricarboxylate transporter receptor subunit TctC
MKVKLRMVPYGGAGESIKALLGAHVDVYGGSVPPGLPHIKAGTVRGAFVTTRERCHELPDLWGVADLKIPEAETFIWWGAIGPKNIPPERLAILEKALRQAAQSEKVRNQIRDLGGTLVASPSAQFQAMVRAESAAMAVAAKEIGLVPK